MKPQTILEAIAQTSATLERCRESKNEHWETQWEQYLRELLDLLPSGSGFDNGTRLESASASRVEFSTSFHHMDDNGFYDGWTEHRVIVSAEFGGFDIRVTGRNKRDIKDYIADVFHAVLSSDAPEPSWRTHATA